ncbi:MAG TPA: crosslink repair DNA glycosylase YcaQ family protein, partial [Anaerolineae bacterium]|nr:crosslink repair DNA glycosylase YcaQ family protein [Anaerolineae bacterium]
MIRATQAQAAHFILTKNYLAAPKAPQLLELIKTMVGLPGEPALAPLLAAYARLAHLSPADLLTELYQTRTLIKSSLMRSASYIVPVEDFVSLHAATARQRHQDFNSEFRLWSLDNSEVEALEKPILAAIGAGPATAETIIERLPSNLVRELSQTSRGGRVSATSNVALVLRWLAAQGILGVSPERPNYPGAMHFESMLHPKKETYAPFATLYPSL